ncbi:MAG: hypothetical protein AAF218_08405 [Pseudomonadota bacterium]
MIRFSQALGRLTGVVAAELLLPMAVPGAFARSANTLVLDTVTCIVGKVRGWTDDARPEVLATVTSEGAKTTAREYGSWHMATRGPGGDPDGFGQTDDFDIKHDQRWA